MAKKTHEKSKAASSGRVTAVIAGEVMRVTEKAVLVRAYGGHEPLWLPKSQLDREPPRQGGWIDRASVPRWLARDKGLTVDEVVAETADGQEVRARGRMRGLKGTPRQLDFALDGKLLAACDDKYDLRMWGIESGSDWFDQADKCLALPRFVDGGQTLLALRNRGATAIQAFNTVGGQAKPPIVCFQESTPAAMVISADGKRLAVGGVWRGTEEGLIQVCDITPQADAVVQPESVWQIECEAPVDCLAITSNGDFIAAVCGDGQVRVWNAEDGQLIGCAKVADKTASPLHVVLFTADGRLITTTGDGPTRIWQTENVKPTDEIGVAGASLALAPDGNTLAIGGVGKKSEVVIWDLERGTQVVAIPGHEDVVCSLAFADGGSLLAAADASSILKLWQIGSSHVAWAEVPHWADTAPPKPPQLSSGSKWLERFKALKGHRAGVHGVEFSADGDSLLAWDGDDSFRLWDVETGKSRVSKRIKGPPFARFTPGSDQIVTLSDVTTLKLWDVGEKLQQARTMRCLERFSPRSVSVSPDGRLVALGGITSGKLDGLVQVVDLEYGEQRAVFVAHQQTLMQLAFSPNSALLATAGADGCLRVWDTSTWNLAYEWRDADLPRVSGVLFHPSGDTLISSGKSGVKLWEIGSPKPMQVIPGEAYSLALSPDHRTLAIGAGGATDTFVRLWDLDTGAEVARTGDHYTMPVDLSFSPDGALLAVADQSRTLNIWQVNPRASMPDVVDTQTSLERDKLSVTPDAADSSESRVAVSDDAAGQTLEDSASTKAKQPTKKKSPASKKPVKKKATKTQSAMKKSAKKETAKAAAKRHRAPRTKGEQEAFEELYEAISRGDVATVRELIAEGIDVNLIDVCNTPPLMLATQTGSGDIMRLLIEAGAEIEYVDADGFTPLSWSAYEDRPDLVEVLLAAGADADRSALGIAIGHSEASAGLLIDAGADVNPKRRKKDPWPFLLAAVNKKSRDLVAKLLEKGADTNATNNYGWNAWMLATLLKEEQIANMLLEHGADRGDPQRPELFHAVWDNKVERARSLIEGGADVNAQDPWGKTALNWCCAQKGAQEHLWDMCCMLLEAGADVNIKDQDGGLPMSYATMGEPKLFALLLNKGGKIRKTAASAALLTACQEGEVELARQLIGRGANVDKRDKEKRPCIAWAAAEGHAEIVRLLLDAGADPNLVGRDGYTALISATMMGHLDCMRLLLDAGVDVNAKGKFLHRTALLNACDRGEAQAVRLLLDAGADPHVCSRSGHDAIVEARNSEDCLWLVRRHIADEGLQQAEEAAGNDNSPEFFDSLRRKCRLKLADWILLDELDVARGLIAAGVFADQEGDFGTRPLHAAVRRRELELTQTLLDAGADIDARDGDGNVALEYALWPPRDLRLVRLLLDRGASTKWVHQGFLDKAFEEVRTGVVQDEEVEEEESVRGEPSAKVGGDQTRRDRRSAFGEQFSDRVREGTVLSQAEADVIVSRHADFLAQVPPDAEIRWSRYHLDTPDAGIQLVSDVGSDEHQASFRWVTLRRLRLEGVCLRISNWSGSRLHACELTDCDLSDSISVRGKATGTTWRDCTMSRNDWSQKNVAECRLESCRAPQLDLDRSRLLETQFVDCDLQRSNFQGAHLQQLMFERCDLRGANFRDAKLFSCQFNNCRLTRDVFRWAHVYSSCSYDPDLEDQIEESEVS